MSIYIIGKQVVKEKNMLTKQECQQAIDNLWRMWDRTDNRAIRKNIQVSVEMLDSTINEIEINGEAK